MENLQTARATAVSKVFLPANTVWGTASNICCEEIHQGFEFSPCCIYSIDLHHSSAGRLIQGVFQHLVAASHGTCDFQDLPISQRLSARSTKNAHLEDSDGVLDSGQLGTDLSWATDCSFSGFWHVHSAKDDLACLSFHFTHSCKFTPNVSECHRCTHGYIKQGPVRLRSPKTFASKFFINFLST